MKNEFKDILTSHQTRYPLMQPQDYGKLAYQSQFGPEHLAPDRERFLSYLRKEWAAVPTDGSPQPSESIGNGLCRFHLTGEYDATMAAPLLAELFLLTVEQCHGTMAGLAEHLTLLESLDVPGMTDWLTEYRRQGCPPVHHSQIFRDAYQPHYRLLRTEYAGYFPLLLRISALAAGKKPAVVAIDGRCGSGKTELARLVSRLFPCNVFHLDDFYLPIERRLSDWENTPGGNMDLARFLVEVLIPARSGKAVSYMAFDCRNGSMKPAVLYPARELIVVEGSYSHHPLLNAQYDLKIFLTCSKEEQTRRLRAREGEYFHAFATRWIPMEERYIQSCGVEYGDAVVVDTSAFF
ncbi:MAG: hypothetical protein Q4B96_06355 [Bacillota bacterium]|nr:hypothetical protein [Bacillota bacterium]